MSGIHAAKPPTQIVTQKCQQCGVRVGAPVPIPCADWYREQELSRALRWHERRCDVEPEKEMNR